MPELRLTTRKGCSEKLSPLARFHCTRAFTLSDSLAESLWPWLTTVLSWPVSSRCVVAVLSKSSLRSLRVAFSVML